MTTHDPSTPTIARAMLAALALSFVDKLAVPSDDPDFRVLHGLCLLSALVSGALSVWLGIRLLVAWYDRRHPDHQPPA